MNVFDALTLSKSIPVNLLITALSEQLVINGTCRSNGWQPGSSDCTYAVAANKFVIEQKLKLGSLGNASVSKQFKVTTESDLNFFLGSGVQFTADKLAEILTN